MEKASLSSETWTAIDVLHNSCFPSQPEFSLTKTLECHSNKYKYHLHWNQDKKELVAMVVSVPDHKVQEHIWLTNICTTPLFRRQGIMHALLNKVLSHDSNKIYHLSVNETNLSALALYRKLGFKENNRIDGWITMVSATR